jgi:hypothetical protein
MLLSYESDSDYIRATEAVVGFKSYSREKKRWEFCEPFIDNEKIELVENKKE